jgi:hypothetical protein
MWRLGQAAILVGAVALGSAAPAAAFDYEEPVVPAELRMTPPAPASNLDDATLRLQLLRQGTGAVQVSPDTASNPGSPPVVTRGQCGEDTGRALWNWNSC